jgi:glycosyltransferase involved in cell wall biosynthesis
MTRPLQVCHISTVHTPFDQRIFHRECWSLARAGFEVHLAVELDLPEQVLGGVHLHSLAPVRRRTLGLRLGDRLRRLVRAAALARRLRADVYHLHDPELIPLGLWLKRRRGTRVVFDCHENNTAYLRQKRYLPALVRWLLLAGMWALESLAARILDAIVTADQGVAELYRGRYRARRVVVVHNFPRLDLFRAAHANGKREFDLVYHGSIPRYHLEAAFAVAEELRRRGLRARWLFFGRCPESEWARRELARRGLEQDFVIDPELVPHERVAERVQKARVGFIPLPDLPKFQHNIPTKLFEFMGLGMPVVLSDLPPSRPFVGDGECAVMVPPDDHAAWADAIERLLRDPENARRMGAAGVRRVHEAFNWERESAKLLELYGTFSTERS